MTQGSFVPATRLTLRQREMLERLQERFASSQAGDRATDAERRAAAEVEAERLELGRVTGTITACSGCARGMELPEGAADGGRCCAGATDDVFHPEEVDLLTLLGVGAGDLVPPAEPAVRGCSFRGTAGCSLPSSARPTICLHYMCREYLAELSQRDPTAAIRAGAAQDRLANAMRRYNHARSERIAEDEFRELFELPALRQSKAARRA